MWFVCVYRCVDDYDGKRCQVKDFDESRGEYIPELINGWHNLAHSEATDFLLNISLNVYYVSKTTNFARSVFSMAFCSEAQCVFQ